MNSHLDLISIIIPTFNQKQLLIKSLSSIYNNSYSNYEIIIINNNPKPINQYLKKYFPKLKKTIVINNISNQYFASSINQGIEISHGKYILIFNDDAILKFNSLEIMLQTIKKNSNTAAVCPKIIKWPSEKIDSLGCAQDIFGFNYKVISKFRANKFFYFAIGLYRKDILVTLKAYDPKFTIFWEDVDLCWHIWLSGENISFQPQAIIYHHVSQSTNQLNPSFSSFHIRKNRIRGLIKNYSFLSLIFILPSSILLHLLLSIYESLSQKNKSPFSATIKAIAWNLVNIISTLKQRHFIQSKIRKLSDFQILKKMYLFPRSSQTI